MSNRRLEIHKIFCDILGCPEEGPGRRAYFDPPANIRMEYPAIVYYVTTINSRDASNGVYIATPTYSCTLITKDQDIDLIRKLAFVPRVSMSRSYVADNLRHWPFTIY